jgi:hypothetical protein
MGMSTKDFQTLISQAWKKLTEGFQTLRRKEAKKAAGGSWFG